MYYEFRKVEGKDSPTWIHTLNMSNTPKVLDDMHITNTRLVCWGVGRRGGVHESFNKEKLNLYLDLCNNKHAYGLVFRV
jgi:hypothetical protein